MRDLVTAVGLVIAATAAAACVGFVVGVFVRVVLFVTGT